MDAVPFIFKTNVTETLEALLEQEDTDGDIKITILDNGPKVCRITLMGRTIYNVLILLKVISLGTATSDCVKKRELRGTYQLANLLEKLYLINGKRGLDFIYFSEVAENPVDRIDRKIRNQYWTNLTRQLDESMIEIAAPDPKDWNENPRPRIYVPFGEERQHNYYSQIARDRPHLNLDVQYLPQGEITPEFVHNVRDRPGLLALEMDYTGGPSAMRGLEFIVPGGRFNECYYWDSYFTSLGLLQIGRTELVRQIVQNFVFEIRHYGKIPNANRSYYLCRSQPPFLTDLAVQTFKAIRSEVGAVEFLRTAILAAIKEYRQVWMAEPRYDPVTGLSRYRPPGLGIPLEVESGHFDYILAGYAKNHNITIPEFIAKYNDQSVKEPELDEFFAHDRGVRESGHDTSYVLQPM
jgi:alpha,alpha-trehalase